MKSFIILVASLWLASCSSYHGKAWNGEPAKIPGRIVLVEFDKGGEGIAYHDMDELNNGVFSKSGDGEELGFRKEEGVDTKHCKKYDFHVDGSAMNHEICYIGWNAPGEWRKHTVEVLEDGCYAVGGTLSMAKDEPAFELIFDDGAITGPVSIPNTGGVHKWNKHESLTKVYLKKGVKVMTLKVLGKGMNFHDLIFKKID